MMKMATACLALLGCCVVVTAAHADCGPKLSALKDKLRAGDLNSAAQMEASIGLAIECAKPQDRQLARRLLAESLLVEIKGLRAEPSRAEDMARLIEQAAALNASWEAWRDLGDLQVVRLDYTGAATSYQKAIEWMANNEAADVLAKRRAEINYLKHRADETRLLAASGANGTLVASLTARDGTMGGVFSAVLDRGPVAMHVPAPILFEFGSDEFTSVGKQAAEELAKLLLERSPASVTVTGHTDQLGSDDYNIKLSQKRATQVAAFLKHNGLNAAIKTVAKGRSEPLILSSPNTYSQSQINELNRRVEFDWK